jgi:hypothetical protein
VEEAELVRVEASAGAALVVEVVEVVVAVAAGAARLLS